MQYRNRVKYNRVMRGLEKLQSSEKLFDDCRYNSFVISSEDLEIAEWLEIMINHYEKRTK